MTRAIPVVVFAVAALLACRGASAAEPLRWEWTAGDTQRLLVTRTAEVTTDAGAAGSFRSETTLRSLLRWEVEEIDAEGAATLRQTTERVVIHSDGAAGVDYAYDSAGEAPPVGLGAIAAPLFEALIEHPVGLTMLPTGEVTNADLPEPLTDAMARLPGGALTGELFTGSVKAPLPVFAGSPVEPGAAWSVQSESPLSPPLGSLRVVSSYTYEGPRTVEGRPLAVVRRSDRADTPVGGAVRVTTLASSGETLFDPATGRLVRSTLAHRFEVAAPEGSPAAPTVVDMTVVVATLAAEETPDLALEPATEH